MTLNIKRHLDGVNTLAAPAVGHWGAFPLDLQQFIFAVHFRAVQILTAAFARLPLQIYLYSASAASVCSVAATRTLFFVFVSLYMIQIIFM